MAGVVIIGGGVIGLSVAYHLAKRGAEDIVLLERNQLTSGTSWHAAGIVGPLRATPNMTKLASYAGKAFTQLEAEMGMATGYRRTGGYWLARKTERMDELKRIASLGRHFGLGANLLTAEDLHARLPFLDVAGHVGGISVEEDAHVNPVDLCMAYAKGAKNGGVVFREGAEVETILTQNRQVLGVRLNDGEELSAPVVILCAGAWSKPLAEGAGMPLPLQAVEHMYITTEPITGLPDPFPVLRDLDTGIYVKGDVGGKLIIGGFEPDAKCWDAFGAEGRREFLELPEDWEQFTPFMEAALDLVPSLAEAGVQRFMNGPESFTADTRPLVGQSPRTDGLFVAAGMNSVGVMSSAGIGKVLASWVMDGHAPMDLWEIDIARIDPKSANQTHMTARMQEAVADQFAMHWPFKQPRFGRGLRVSCLHEKWQAEGAVFGLTAGWERGLWYAKDEAERNLPYSTGVQPWYSIVEREAAEMEKGTVLLDLSPFTKIKISGVDSLEFLQKLSCRSLDIPAGRAVYVLFLNERGGIEVEATITRLAETDFLMTSGAATRWRDCALLRRAALRFAVQIDDVTEEEAVIGVMGGGARDLLATVISHDWDDFEFGTSRGVCFAGKALRATCLSFVGELGWELNIHHDDAGLVFDALIDHGAKPMGHYALDACRIEKGYYHWGHDIGPEINPLEAGLSWLIDWKKGFIGKDALMDVREAGITRRLILLKVEGEPLILHDEPVWEGSEIVGLTTSGGRGARSGLTLAFALIDIARSETKSETCQRDLHVEIAGQFYSARALMEAPFDPKGERMQQ